jgi:hypothetical protein
MSKFTGGSSSKDKQDIAPAVQAGASGPGAAAAAAEGTPTAVDEPVAVTKADEATEKEGALRGNIMMYRASKNRDPFRSLVSADGDNRTEIVDLSVVKLVGIVWNGDSPFCIVEDAEGIAYVLRKGDRVKNGRVVSVREDALVASQTILGYTTTVRLRLQEGKGVKNG